MNRSNVRHDHKKAEAIRLLLDAGFLPFGQSGERCRRHGFLLESLKIKASVGQHTMSLYWQGRPFAPIKYLAVIHCRDRVGLIKVLKELSVSVLPVGKTIH